MSYILTQHLAPFIGHWLHSCAPIQGYGRKGSAMITPTIRRCRRPRSILQEVPPITTGCIGQINERRNKSAIWHTRSAADMLSIALARSTALHWTLVPARSCRSAVDKKHPAGHILSNHIIVRGCTLAEKQLYRYWHDLLGDVCVCLGTNEVQDIWTRQTGGLSIDIGFLAESPAVRAAPEH